MCDTCNNYIRQGISLTRPFINLNSSVLSCCDAYAILSRIKKISELHLININNSCVKPRESSITEYNRLRLHAVCKSRFMQVCRKGQDLSKPVLDVQKKKNVKRIPFKKKLSHIRNKKLA